MRKLRCSIILAVALSMLVCKCFAETAAEISARNALAEQYGLYGDFRMKYYINSDLANETAWIKEVEEAARLITNYSCVTVERTSDSSDYDVIISGGRAYYNIDAELPCTSWYPHPSKKYTTFRLDLQDKWDVLRVFLLCLAPFKDEFLRKDRDDYVNIDWDNIIGYRHPMFIKSKDYPPDLPGFSGYCHGCVVNRPLTYFSKDGRWTILPRSSRGLYKYKRWPVDLQRLRLYYRQLEVKKTRVQRGWFYDSIVTYYGPKPGCDVDLEEVWD